MRPRRSRFTRIYRKLTRRGPNRHKQWNEIVNLRPQGSIGHPAQAIESTTRVAQPIRASRQIGRGLGSKAFYPPPLPSENFEPQLWSPEPAPEPEILPARSSSGAVVAALVASLFLLACAYAAFSGFFHSYNDGFAYVGILGAIGSLMAAGIGVCLAASTLRRPFSGKFLSLCVVSFATLYGLLLFLAMGR